MVQIAFSILILAIGVHLLIKVKTSGLGGIYKGLAWLVILLSIGFMLCGVARARMHMKHMHEYGIHGHCGMRGGCPMMGHGECGMGMENCCSGASMKCCSKDSGMTASCCKDMKSNSGSCMDMQNSKGKAACCTKGMSADSTAKK